MRSPLKFFLPALAASLALAACGSSSSSSSTQASTPATTATPASSGGATAAVIKTASNSTLGATVLVNAQGMTLYHLSGEQSGKFICTSAACVATWPPVRASSAGTPTGSVAKIGTVGRPNGTMQVTYNGEPLYTFSHDKAGQANGQGIKDVGTWTAVTTSASGAPAKAAAPAAAAPAAESSSESSGGGGGGGYSY
jgi:predicted lipoprotein with Yx(FWY)xxD motif